MRKNLTYLFSLLLTALFLLPWSGTAWAATVDVADGSATSSYVPFYGYYGDWYERIQVIYPASEMPTVLKDKQITAMTFYLSSSASAAWTAQCSIGLANVTAGDLSSGWNSTSTTEVYTGTLNGTGSTMTLTFNTENSFVYSGGNLLFELKVTTKGTNYPAATFTGKGSTSAARYGYNSSSIGSVNNNSASFIPKTTFTYSAASNCKKPNLSFVGKTSTSASFSWTAGESGESTWEYVCLRAATTITDSHWESATSTTSTSVVIDTLQAFTPYKFYLRAVCGGEDAPSSPSVHEFTTKPALPWTEGFENYAAGSYSNVSLNDSWDVLNNSGASGSYPQIYVTSKTDSYGGSYVQTGSRALFFKSSSSKYAYVVLPEFERTIDVLKISFSYKFESQASGRTVTLGYMTDPEDESTFHVIQSFSHTTSWTTVSEKAITGVANEDKATARIAFRYGKASDNYYFGLDDITVALNQDCSAPQDVAAAQSGTGEMTASWTANAGVDSYIYRIVARDASPVWDEAPSTATNSVEVSELAAGDYDFYVKCECGGESDVTGPVQFTIESCQAITDVAHASDVYNGTTVTWANGGSGPWAVSYSANGGAYTSAATGLTSRTFTFDKDHSPLTAGTAYTIKVASDCAEATTTYTPICPTPGALTLSGETYNGVTVSWDAVAGITDWNLRYRKGSDSWTEVEVENALTYTIASGLATNQEYTIELQSECEGSWSSTTYTPVYEKPTVLTASPVKDVTATINWSSVDGATGYQYSCVLQGNEPSWSETVTASSANLSGLTVAANYTASVRAVFGTAPNIGYSEAKTKDFTTVCQAPTSLVKGETSSSSLAFSWSKSPDGADNQYQYVCKEGSTAPTTEQWATNGVLLAEGVRTATVTGLSANTTYYFFVRSYYGDGKYSADIYTYNTTDCGTNAIGWSESFGSTLDACWSTYYTYWSSSSYQWKPSTDYAKRGSYSMQVYSYQYSSSNIANLETPPVAITEKANVSFFYMCSSAVPFSVVMKVNGKETVLASYNEAKSSFGTDSTVVAIPDTCVGKTISIIFRATGAGTSYKRKLYIDEVRVNYAPTTAPTSLAAEATADGANVSWEHAEDGPFDLQYRTNGVGDWTTVNGINAKNYTTEGLTAGTEYEVQVRASISAHRISSWTASQTFTPISCPTISAVTFGDATYNSVVVNWTAEANNTWELQYKAGDAEWATASNTISEQTYTLEDLTTGTAYGVRVKANCADADAWVAAETTFTPAYSVPASANVTSISDATATASWDEVADAASYEWVVVETGETPDWENDAVAAATNSADLSGLVGATNYTLHVRAVYPTGNSDATTHDFQTSTVAPTALTQGTTTVNSIAFSWSYAGAAEKFQWKSSKSGSNWSAPISELSATETSLNAGTSYTIYVRAYYADGKYSSELSETFGTECAVETLPFSQDFEAGTSPLCWSAMYNTLSYYDYDGNYGWKVTDESDNYVMRFKSGNSFTVPALTLPQIDLTSTPAVLSFKVRNVYSNKTVAGKVIISADEMSDQETVLTTSSSLTEQRIDLSSFAGKRITIKFQATSNVASGRIDLDDIRILEQLNLADNVDNSTTLSTYNGKTADVTIGRTFVKAGYYNTICLPFDLSADELAASPIASNDLWAFKYAREEAGELLIRIIETDHINAGEPYLIAWPAGDPIVNPLFKNVTISASAGKTMGNENLKFTGILAPETFAAHDDTKLFLYTENKLYWWDGDAESTMNSFRAYFLIDNSGSSSHAPIRRGMPARIIKQEQVATGVGEVQGNHVQSTKILENNQVVIIRNGEKYNVQGQKIQ